MVKIQVMKDFGIYFLVMLKLLHLEVLKNAIITSSSSMGYGIYHGVEDENNIMQIKLVLR